ncbi:MAG: ferredoxin [Bacteriovoracaceae bacterium]|jgi:ferredoxin
MPKIVIFGRASQKDIMQIEVLPQDFEKNLMDFLREKGLPIASSCLGKGQCRHCIINGFLLSCSVTVKEFLRNSSQPLDARCEPDQALVTIDYL